MYHKHPGSDKWKVIAAKLDSFLTVFSSKINLISQNKKEGFQYE